MQRSNKESTDLQKRQGVGRCFYQLGSQLSMVYSFTFVSVSDPSRYRELATIYQPDTILATRDFSSLHQNLPPQGFSQLVLGLSVNDLIVLVTIEMNQGAEWITLPACELSFSFHSNF